MELRISEICSSLQGEGKYTGLPTTFIRLHGCNLRCAYCDAKYAYNGESKLMSEYDIIEEVLKMGNKYVCITGGEPLIQAGATILAIMLHGEGLNVSIETNGAVLVSNYENRPFTYCMDIKCPSSKMDRENIYENLALLRAEDEVKFVITHKQDYNFAKKVLESFPTEARVIFSPTFDGTKNNGAMIAEWLLEDKLENVRLGLQIHKLIGIY